MITKIIQPFKLFAVSAGIVFLTGLLFSLIGWWALIPGFIMVAGAIIYRDKLFMRKRR